ncbi:MAG: autotransporter outer membrane beta-barrel domain-containing protein, partial [Phreatobacter sp.]
GGAGGTAVNPDGAAGGSGLLGTGGGGGGYNGTGAGISVLTNTSPLRGGHGGNGGNIPTGSSTGGGGGGGGAGGYGAVVTGAGASGNSSSIAGGNGGHGGNTDAGFAGGGGDGGIGILFTAPGAAFSNGSTAAVLGGNGGNGGPSAYYVGGAAGAGGAAVVISGGSLDNAGTIRGGLGGEGGLASSAGTAAAGGAGIDGSHLVIVNSGGGTIAGGSGGLGGTNGYIYGGADGGRGGTAIRGSALTIDNAGTLSGGVGGAGGSASIATGGNGATGGTGIDGSQLTIVNSGTISGGAGGAGGAGGHGPAAALNGTAGAGGIGITGSTIGIVNSGTISGGLSGDGTTRAAAIVFSGGQNRLELRAGSQIVGAVDANAGTTSTLALGGTAAGSFDVSAIGPSAQYRGFQLYDKSGTGTWTLTGTTSAVTPWTLSQGSLSIASDTSLGAAGGSLTFNGGTLQVTGTSFTGTTRTIVWGANGGGFDIADGRNSFTVGQSLTGGGPLTKTGAGTLTLNGQNSYAGATTVDAGKLVVGDAGHAGASLASIVTVNNGGSLGGIGSVGGLVVMAGGVVAPGNSIGILQVKGNISIAAGAIYQVEINPAGDSDRIAASGTATLSGGTVAVDKSPGAYVPGSRYTILTAQGGITGHFAGLTQNLPFVDLLLAYGRTSVYLDVARNQVAFPSVGVSRNQITTATAVEALGSGTALYDAVVQQTSAAAARAAFDALSGELHAGLKGALIDDSRFLRDAVIDRTRQATMAAGAPALTAGPQQMALLTPGSVVALWSQAYGAWGRRSGDGNAAALSRSIGGFFAGADMPLGLDMRLGMAGGYGRSTFGINGRGSGAGSDDYHLALYGGGQWGGFGVRLGAAYTWHQLETRRTIAFSGFGDSASARYQARTAQVFAELGYRFDGDATALEPFVNLAAVRLDTDAFRERGGATALSANADSMSATTITSGLRAAVSFAPADMAALTARGTLGWRHAFGDLRPGATLGLSGGSPFGIAGLPIARDALVIEAGLDMAVSRAVTLGIAYGGQIARGVADHGLKGNLVWKF